MNLQSEESFVRSCFKVSLLIIWFELNQKKDVMKLKKQSKTQCYYFLKMQFEIHIP